MKVFHVAITLLLIQLAISVNYCGSSFGDASSSCRKQCPRGLDGECDPGHRCYAHVPCSGSGSSSNINPNSNYCGSTYSNANSCFKPCPRGLDGECGTGQRCYGKVPCGGPAAPEKTHTSSCSNLQNPYSPMPRGYVAKFNPIMNFVVGKINACFSRSEIDVCKTYVSAQSSSDHPGNAADCYQYYKTAGDRLAQWAVANRYALKVKYVIWYGKIWSRAYPYWRPYTGPNPHTDHVHISVISN